MVLLYLLNNCDNLTDKNKSYNYNAVVRTLNNIRISTHKT